MTMFTTGQEPSASDLSSPYAIKPADEARASTATPTNDADMLVAGVAGRTYAVTFMARTTGAGSATLGDITFQWTFPTGAGATLALDYLGLTSGVAYGVSTTGNVNAISTINTTSASTAVPFGTPSTNFSTVIGTGLWVVGASSGNLQLQWSQRVSTGTATTLGKGSYILLTRMI
jgi:hypothetical protein